MIDFKMIGNYRAKYKRVNIWPTIDFNTKNAKHEQQVRFFATCTKKPSVGCTQ